MTVEPLSAAVGVSIRESPLLSEEGYPGRERKAVSLIRASGSENTAAVICSQGGVIPDVLQRLSEEDAVELQTPPPSKKGSVWSLTFDQQRLIAAEYFPPIA
jgi:8-oxo-dGTP diphosphatase